MKSVGLVSAVFYLGISLAAAGLFILAATPSTHTPVERIGGAAWVFFLSVIILMPVVIPIVKRRLGQPD
jgi:hypothetical protein